MGVVQRGRYVVVVGGVFGCEMFAVVLATVLAQVSFLALAHSLIPSPLYNMTQHIAQFPRGVQRKFVHHSQYIV